MVKLKEITVSLQVCKNGTWTACEEFESLKSVKDKFNSAKNLSTCVQCMPGRFRFEVTLSAQYVWASEANALSIDLTFDGGNPIDHYRVVVLKPSAEPSAKELGLKDMTQTDNGLSYHIERIAMPLDTADASSPWFETGFEFERYARDPTKSKPNRTSSAYKGSLKMEVQPCVAKRNTRQKACIPIQPKLEATWSDRPPAHEVTLKPALKADTTRQCSSACRYICTKAKDTESVSFMFYYREKGSYDKLHEEDVEIVTDDREGVEKENRSSGYGSGNKSLTRLLAAADKVSRRPPMSQVVNHVVQFTPEQSQYSVTKSSLLAVAAVGSPTDVIRNGSMSTEKVEDEDFTALASKTEDMYRLIKETRRQEALAEQKSIRRRRQEIERETQKTKKSLEETETVIARMSDALIASRAKLSKIGAHLQGLNLEASGLGEQEQRLERRLQGQESYEEENSRQMAKMREGMQDLFNRMHQQHQSLKRRRFS